LDTDLLKERVNQAVEALDEIIDYGYDQQPLDENRKIIEDYRAIGLGVFGLADALIAMEIKYGSPESITF
jgi:ribonucleoside-diphosphate reductase alpha chain